MSGVKSSAGGLTPLDFDPRPSPYHRWDIGTMSFAVASDGLDRLTADKRSAADAERERRGYLPITYAGALFDADAKAQRNISAWLVQVSSGTGLPAGFVWRDYDNNDHSCDAAFLSGLGGAITVRGTQLYQVCWAHKAEIERIAGTGDFDALLAYDVTAGWP